MQGYWKRKNKPGRGSEGVLAFKLKELIKKGKQNNLLKKNGGSIGQ